jgi:hypothetical protein
MDACPKSGHSLLSVSVLTVEVGLFLERYTMLSRHDAVPEEKKQQSSTVASKSRKKAGTVPLSARQGAVFFAWSQIQNLSNDDHSFF